MQSPAHNTGPSPHLPPSAERQAELTAHLEGARGFAIAQSITYGLTDMWPQGGLHVASLIRPGLSGNVIITPYRTVEQSAQAGNILLRGCGLFAMVYENGANISDVAPYDRQYPEFASLGLPPDNAEAIPLENSGRLLVSKAITANRGGARDQPLETRQQDGVVSVERLVATEELQPLMARLAIGAGLEGRDADTFIKQPFRKIECYIEPEYVPPPIPPSRRRRWLRL